MLRIMGFRLCLMILLPVVASVSVFAQSSGREASSANQVDFVGNTATCASSYDAIYKPQSSTSPDVDGYSLSFVPNKEEKYSGLSANTIEVKRVDTDGRLLYEMRFVHSCGGGSYPSCSMTIDTKNGRSIEIIPIALNRDFSDRAIFISNRLPAPYAIIFPGISQKLYYSGNNLHENSLMFHTEAKAPISNFPAVWLISGCKK